jgi:hypothetical protein
MTEIVANLVSAAGGAAIGGTVGSVVTYFLSRRQQKAATTPVLRFDFADLGEHENLGPVGFRHLQSRMELLISGILRNAGAALATDIKLDIYHFRLGASCPVHEIAAIRVADALQPDETLSWCRSIGLADITINGPNYVSGPTGIFSDNTRSKYYHFHVVFSWRNVQGDLFSAIYAMEQVVVNNTLKGNRMVFIRQTGKYDSKANFLPEWRQEI